MGGVTNATHKSLIRAVQRAVLARHAAASFALGATAWHHCCRRTKRQNDGAEKNRLVTESLLSQGSESRKNEGTATTGIIRHQLRKFDPLWYANQSQQVDYGSGEPL